MPFTIVSAPQVSTPIPEAGGECGVSFELAAIGSDTRVRVIYEVRSGEPFVFVPPSVLLASRRAGPELRAVSVAGTDVSGRFKVVKSPAGPPAFVQLFIDIELVEVDATGQPLVFGGIVLPPRQLVAVVTLI